MRFITESLHSRDDTLGRRTYVFNAVTDILVNEGGVCHLRRQVYIIPEASEVSCSADRIRYSSAKVLSANGGSVKEVRVGYICLIGNLAQFGHRGVYVLYNVDHLAELMDETG